jgi:hypothetical protein
MTPSLSCPLVHLLELVHTDLSGLAHVPATITDDFTRWCWCKVVT